MLPMHKANNGLQFIPGPGLVSKGAEDPDLCGAWQVLVRYLYGTCAAEGANLGIGAERGREEKIALKDRVRTSVIVCLVTDVRDAAARLLDELDAVQQVGNQRVAGCDLQEPTFSQVCQVVLAREAAIDRTPELLLVEFELLTNAVLHWQVSGASRALGAEDHSAFVLEPGQAVAALTRAEVELRYDAVELFGLHAEASVTNARSLACTLRRSGPNRASSR